MLVDDKLAKEKLARICQMLSDEGMTKAARVGKVNRQEAFEIARIEQSALLCAAELIRNTDLTDCQPQKAMNEHSSGTRATVPPSATPSGTQRLLDRCRDALKRIHDGGAPMRIPADMTDADIVLADCIEEIIRLDRALSYERIDVPHIERQLWKEAVAENSELQKLIDDVGKPVGGIPWIVPNVWAAAREALRTTEGNARESASDAGSGINPDVADQGSVRNATDWTSVDERLPDDTVTGFLLVYGRGAFNDAPHPWVCGGGAFVDKSWAKRFNVTHWMPAPLSPDAIRALPDQKD